MLYYFIQNTIIPVILNLKKIYINSYFDFKKSSKLNLKRTIKIIEFAILSIKNMSYVPKIMEKSEHFQMPVVH